MIGRGSALRARRQPAPLYPPDPLRDDERTALLEHPGGQGLRVVLTNRLLARLQTVGRVRRFLGRTRSASGPPRAPWRGCRRTTISA